MRYSTLIGLFFLTLPGFAFAQGAETACTYGDMVRRVVVMSEPGVTVPCEVHYFKDTEAPGEDQVLWSAASQAGYCEEKAAGLVAKLEGWGWDCGTATPPPESEEPTGEVEEPADTTGDLEPADPDTPDS